MLMFFNATMHHYWSDQDWSDSFTYEGYFLDIRTCHQKHYILHTLYITYLFCAGQTQCGPHICDDRNLACTLTGDCSNNQGCTDYTTTRCACAMGWSGYTCQECEYKKIIVRGGRGSKILIIIILFFKWRKSNELIGANAWLNNLDLHDLSDSIS